MNNWLDHTTQWKLLGVNFLFSTGLAASELLKIAQAYGTLLVGVVLVGIAQLLKMWRDHVSWQAEERRKEELHRRQFSPPAGHPE